MKEQKQLFKVRDLRKKDQFKIDDKYLNGYAKILGVYSTAVYASLTRHAEFNSQKAFPSEKLIAEEHSITERCVRNEIKKLKLTNIIAIEKERSSKGQWLNNLYILLDKSEWKKPEELKDLWKTRGTERPNQRNLTTEPEELKVPLRIHIKKDTNKKDNKLAKPSFAGKEVNLLIEKFKGVNPSYEQLFKNKTQRGALQRLVKKYGVIKTGNMIDYLPKIFGKPYAPVITTPYLLEQKLANLINYIQQRSQKKPNIVKI